MKKKILSIGIAVIMLALVAGCGGSSGGTNTPSPSAASTAPAESTAIQPRETDIIDTEPPKEEGAISLTDMMGREIELDKPIEKAIALTPADCEIIYALGAEDILVGRGEYCDYPEQVLDIVSVQSGEDANVEQIIALQPEAIFMSTMAHSEELVKQLEDAGITVIASEAADIEGVYTAIDLIGKAVGKSDEASALIENMKDTFDKIVADVPEQDEKKTIYFEVSPLEYGLYTAGSGTFMNEIADLLGLDNIFADVEGWPEVSQEQVIERNPDYIVTITMYFGEGQKPDEEITGRDGWADITAIKDGNVFLANSDELSRPGPRLVDGAKELFNFVYGE